MVSLVWFILSLFGVCEFSWWPVFIESIIATILFGIDAFTKFDSDRASIGCLPPAATLGVFIFAAFKLFCGLTVSSWWILLSPLSIIPCIIPGAPLLILFLLEKYSLVTHLPLVFWIIAIAVSVLYIICYIAMFIEWITDKKKGKRR